MTENIEKIPTAYIKNMTIACVCAFTGRRVQQIKVTLPIDELTGDYLAGLVSGLTHEERDFFAESLDAQVITCGLTNASVITEPRILQKPHWVIAMYAIKYAGDVVRVDVDVITCKC